MNVCVCCTKQMNVCICCTKYMNFGVCCTKQMNYSACCTKGMALSACCTKGMALSVCCTKGMALSVCCTKQMNVFVALNGFNFWSSACQSTFKTRPFLCINGQEVLNKKEHCLSAITPCVNSCWRFQLWILARVTREESVLPLH